MALAVETPARLDITFRDNDDTLVGLHWIKSDAVTPVTVTAAELALGFDPPRTTYDPDTGAPLPPPPAELHSITSTTPGDPAGWIDADRFADGYVLVTVPHNIWAGYTGRAGIVDVVAVGEGIQRCLGRGRFNVEGGVA